LTSVHVTAAGGASLAGRLTPDGTRWTSSAPLALSTTYTVAGIGAGSSGSPQRLTSTFRTVTPAALTYPSVIPLRGETVGVGLPVIIYWSHRVTDRAGAERLLTVTADKPVTGSWHWLSSTEVHYRPRTFWPAYTHVSVHIAVGGRNLGGGVYGEQSRTIDFTVGSSVISRVNNATKTMTVTQNGKALRTMPVSLGKASTPTSSGTMVVITKFDQKYFDSASFGVPRDSAEGYYTKVFWDTKYTYGGEYVHAAPWSVGQQGRANVSHGCVNVSTDNAKWFYYLSKRGDVVQVDGTERAVRPGDGFTDWNVSWSNWVAGSALA
jgi:lipoprotein-anchoring transpeptidase ErfK/SrfK